MTRTEILNAVKALLPNMPIDREKRTDINPIYAFREYRGKRRHLVGYYWSRPQATYYGMAYDCILGYGDTPEAAIEKMKAVKGSAT